MGSGSTHPQSRQAGQPAYVGHVFGAGVALLLCAAVLYVSGLSRAVGVVVAFVGIATLLGAFMARRRRSWPSRPVTYDRGCGFGHRNIDRSPVVGCLRNGASLVIRQDGPQEHCSGRADDLYGYRQFNTCAARFGCSVQEQGLRLGHVGRGLPVTVVSLLLGMAPYDVEDNQANFIPCGRMLFHVGPRPSSWCEAVPFWGVVAEVGLVIAACLVLAATLFGIRSAMAQRASGAPT